MNKEITAKELGGLLFNIHSHAETEYFDNPDQIVYKEDDIILLLTKLGYPIPEWGENIDIDKF